MLWEFNADESWLIIIVTRFIVELTRRNKRCCIDPCVTAWGVSYLLLGAARLDEDGKVSDLVWDLVQQDGEGGDGADCWTDQERRSYRQAVSEIMREVSCQVQVTGHLDVCVSGENGARWVKSTGSAGCWWRSECTDYAENVFIN